MWKRGKEESREEESEEGGREGRKEKEEEARKEGQTKVDLLCLGFNSKSLNFNK